MPPVPKSYLAGSLAILLINKTLSSNWRPDHSPKGKFSTAQAIEIRGFRLTLPFPLAYDGNRKNQQVKFFLPDYAIFDLASGTVLDRGNVATRCGLDAAWIHEGPHRTAKCSRCPAAVRP
jgi:hypothetical protein